MLKQILYICTVFLTTIAHAMEKPLLPQIVYNKDSTHNSLVQKLSEKFTIMSTCEQNILSHESPEISRIHSDEYLQNLDKHPSSTLGAINNSVFTWLCPNVYTKTYLPSMLNNVSTTVAATECVISTHNAPTYKTNYAISLAEGYSFAGHNNGNSGDVYAPIPIAAAYALNKNSDIKRILVIDENLTLNTTEYYFTHGNGSIFFTKNNPKLSALFKDKIITHNHIPYELHDYLHRPDNTIDLAFYNINIDDVEPIEDMHPAHAKERELKIHALFSHLIPTIFILSGDKKKYQDDTYNCITQISNIAENINPLDIIEQKWQQTRDGCIAAMQNLISFLGKCRAAIPMPSPIPSPIPSPTQSPRKIPTSSTSLSSSCSDLEQEQHRLRKKLGYNSSESESDYSTTESKNDYDAAETSSSNADDYNSLSFAEHFGNVSNEQ
jgi:hypothetical protein